MEQEQALKAVDTTKQAFIIHVFLNGEDIPSPPMDMDMVNMALRSMNPDADYDVEPIWWQ